MNGMLRFSGSVRREPAIDVWLNEQAAELGWEQLRVSGLSGCESVATAPNSCAKGLANSARLRATATRSQLGRSRSAGATRFLEMSPQRINPHLSLAIRPSLDFHSAGKQLTFNG
jgi:hypothetical protein